MSVFAAAAKLIAALGALGQQGAGLGLDISGWSGSAPNATAAAASATNVAGDSLAPVGVFSKWIVGAVFKSSTPGGKVNMFDNMGGMAGAQKCAQGMSIISWTITIVELLELTTGFGSPYDGNTVKSGSQQFTALAEQLQSALPDTGWDGSASEAYADLDATLSDIAQSMAALDNQLAALVQEHADLVTQMRLGFGILKDLLIAAVLIELAITLTVPAPAGPTAAKGFAIAVAVTGIGAAVAFLATLLGYSIDRAQKANALAKKYSELGAATVQHGSFAQPAVASAAEPAPSVSAFETISADMSVLEGRPPAAFSGRPPAAFSGRPPAAFSAAGPANGPDAPATPAVPQTPDHTTPSAPTLAELYAGSRQAASLSSQLTQHANLVNQAVGQVEKLVQTAQQGQGRQGQGAAPAEEAHARHAALAGDAEGAEASPGTHGAQWAPLEVGSAGAERAHEPSSVERTV